MPKADTHHTRFHNLSDTALADAIGHADALTKAHEAELSALKDEFRRRGLADVAGDEFTVTNTETISGRLDAKAVRAFLGDSYARFERAIVSNVIRVRAVHRLALAA